MKYKVDYSTFFFSDLAVITDYLSQFSSSASLRLKDSLRDRIEKIKVMPNMYEEYRYAPEYRHIVIDKDVVFYQIDDMKKTILLYRFLHGA
jgi:plasmid stabilization system protein ParE